MWVRCSMHLALDISFNPRQAGRQAHKLASRYIVVKCARALCWKQMDEEKDEFLERFFSMEF